MITEFTLGNETIKIVNDTDSESPRNWYNLSEMIFFGRHNHLGDKHNINLPDYDSRDSFKIDGAEKISKELDCAVVIPVNLYQHSGTSISTSNGYPFNCRWDSGTIGFVVVTKKDIRENWGIKNVTKKYIKMANDIAVSEVDTLNNWISGEVYGFEVTDENGDHIDSCYGFYGDNLSTNGISEHIEDKWYEGLEIKS
jgi:hypothetical protein